jgi:hypothetical protein
MIPVASSHIAALGYDALASELYVAFSSPRPTTYVYEGVAKQVFDRLIQSESIGRFFNEEIKGRYPYRTVDDLGEGA